MERRATPRSSASVNVFIPVKGKKHYVCKTIDLSSRGVCLAADSSIFPVDTPIVLFFAVRKHKGSVIQLHRMTAKVVRFGVHGVALAFCPRVKTLAILQKSCATVSVIKRRSDRSSTLSI